MFPIQDQISTATKANLDANFALYTSLASKTLESVEKLINLNFATAKASMEESAAATRRMLAVKDPQEFLAALGEQAKPNLDKAMSYGSRVATIAGGVQSEITKLTEEQIAQASRKFSELFEEAGRNAPAGGDLLAAARSAFGNASATYEQMTRTAKQAIEANMNAVVGQVMAAPVKS